MGSDAERRFCLSFQAAAPAAEDLRQAVGEEL
jgi:hypothetical protein